MNAPAKYRGKKTNAIHIVEAAAVTSQAILLRLNPYAEPLRPINCSEDRFVKSIDPAMKIPLNPRLAKK